MALGTVLHFTCCLKAQVAGKETLLLKNNLDYPYHSVPTDIQLSLMVAGQYCHTVLSSNPSSQLQGKAWSCGKRELIS